MYEFLKSYFINLLKKIINRYTKTPNKLLEDDNLGKSINDAFDKADIDKINNFIERKRNYFDNGLCFNSVIEGACLYGQFEIVKLLIDKTEHHRLYLLFDCACFGGNIDIVNLFIEKGVTDWNSSGLKSACEGGHMNIVELMIAEGSDNWDRGLFGACRGGHMNIVKFMINKGADDWDYALENALDGKHLDIVDLMIDKGGKINSTYITFQYIFQVNFSTKPKKLESIELAIMKSSGFDYYSLYGKDQAEDDKKYYSLYGTIYYYHYLFEKMLRKRKLDKIIKKLNIPKDINMY